MLKKSIVEDKVESSVHLKKLRRNEFKISSGEKSQNQNSNSTDDSNISSHHIHSNNNNNHNHNRSEERRVGKECSS